MKNNGFIKVATVTPKLSVADIKYNIEESIRQINEAKHKNPHFILFPELSVTGYTCQDLFFQNYLIEDTKDAIQYLLDVNDYNGVIIIGAPIEVRNKLYNCAVIIRGKEILGIVPKKVLPNSGEFYEKRWFNTGADITRVVKEIDYIYENVPFGDIIFKEESKNIRFGVEICEDMWSPMSPGSLLAINGAEFIFNLSSSNEILDKDDVRRFTVLSHSRRNSGAYIYCSSGPHESTSDTVFSGHNLVASCGTMLEESELFSRESLIMYVDIDLSNIKTKRRQNSTLRDMYNDFAYPFMDIRFNCDFNDYGFTLEQPLSRTPFVPSVNKEQSFNKILNIQKNALYKRLDHINAKTLIVGISGGLDSTLALLVACKTFDLLNKERKDIIAVTMPGFGTSDRTKTNAKSLAETLGVTLKEYDITNSVLEHFKLIEHDQDTVDVTFENAQARERTNILMNMANKYNGINLGTGNLSELALGWCTYNGDQMSMYAINAGLPKTLVKFMVKGFADYVVAKESFAKKDKNRLKQTLYDVLDTPISPELTGSEQKTEEIIGKYEIHDFIIYRMLVCGDDEARIKYLLQETFGHELSEEEIDEYIKTFYSRFYSQQFKRSAMPEGPKVVDISLSPRADWRMPSDASYNFKDVNDFR
ncbi:NAD(+) synthase [Haloplasma contractile]|uniref:Glutamine-dependent NAD(+) synthetase n=1 Tax=Haloplasma contractile SSD-17B TaxID=1033810 RepID=U2FRW1_9MOLU|nr:NAD(+) synthase [Haloplasma contractile]ERJ13704.1 Glutamine-dependent NAD synthetase protein [Haloplasma contractile SSD-17B]